MKKNKSKRRRVFAASPRQFVAHANAQKKEPLAKIRTIEDVSEIEIKASNLITMTLMLANVQNNYFARAISAYSEVKKQFSQGLKMRISNYIAELEKLKAMSAALADVVQSLHGPEEMSFNRDADYLEELIPLFLDRIGDNSRSDYVAQCILHWIYVNYTSKLHHFEEHGHKHLTRSREESERIRKINAWKRNEKRRKEAVLAGRPAPPELPLPFQEIDKQIYMDF